MNPSIVYEPLKPLQGSFRPRSKRPGTKRVPSSFRPLPSPHAQVAPAAWVQGVGFWGCFPLGVSGLGCQDLAGLGLGRVFGLPHRRKPVRYPKGPSTQQSYTLQNPNLHNYYPKPTYLIIGSSGPFGVSVSTLNP